MLDDCITTPAPAPQVIAAFKRLWASEEEKGSEAHPTHAEDFGSRGFGGSQEDIRSAPSLVTTTGTLPSAVLPSSLRTVPFYSSCTGSSLLDSALAVAVEQAARTDLPPGAERYRSSKARLLLKLCHVLGRRSHPWPFFIAQTPTSILIGLGQQQISFWLRRFQRDRLIIKARNPQRGLAAHYRFRTPLP